MAAGSPDRALLACLVGASILLACAPARSRDPSQSVVRALTAGPQLGPESRIDEPVFTEQSGEQSLPFIAAGGPGAIVVWRDDTRPGLAVSNHPPSFARFDANGNLLDQLPIAITPPTPASMSFTPGILLAAWNGDVALVVWQQSIVNGVELHGSRVTRDGVVLDPGTPELPGGIDIALGTASRTPVAVVPLGSDFLVFWQGGSDGPRVARVGRDGSVPTPGGNAIGFPADGVQRAVLGAVAVTGGALLMVGEGGQVKLMKVDASGAALSALSEGGGVAAYRQWAIASSGSGAIVCWGQSTAVGQPVTVYGRRATADATWVDTAAFQVQAAGATVGQLGAVWDGSRYVCDWTEAGTRVRTTLRAIAASGTPVTDAAVGPTALATAPVQSVQVVWTGGRYLAAMARTVYAQLGSQSLMDRADGVLVRALGADLKPLGTDATVATRQPNQQLNFRAVATPAAAYVVWQDDRARGDVGLKDEENSDTYGARVALTAGVPGKTVTPILSGPDSQVQAGVGWDGTQFTVAYVSISSANGVDRYLQHVSALWTPTGSPISVPQDTQNGSNALLLWNGQSFLLASLYNSGSGIGAISLYRVSAAGALLDAKTGVVMGNYGTDTSNLQGVTIGGKFLLTYQSRVHVAGEPTDDSDVLGLAVNADGTLPATTPIVIATGAGAQDVPAVATDGTSALLVWRDRGSAAPRLMGARLDASLARLDASDAVIAQLTAQDTLGAPALAWTGSEYVAFWTRTGGGSGPIAFAGCRLGADRLCVPGSETSAASDVSVATTGPDGGAPPSVGPGATDDIRGPSLVWTDAGGVLFYRRLDTAPYVNKERVFLRAVEVTAAPPPDGGAGGSGATSDGGAGGSGATSDGGGGSGGAGGGAAGAGGGGSGGVSGDSGAAGTGGASGNQDGGGGAGGTLSDAGKPSSPSQSGCGCAMSRGTDGMTAFPLLALVLTLTFRRVGKTVKRQRKIP